MKNLILITLLTLSFFNINAQDASNDATWEETINFIKSKKEYFDNPHFGSGDDNLVEFKITDEQFYYKTESDSKYGYWYQLTILNFEELEKVADKSLVLYFIDKQKQIRPNGEDSVDESSYEQYLKVSNKEIAARLVKAFQHLAYLATKKREEERKNSNSKF